ncbi:MAG: response regulator [Candidatus Omnitrophica bacterium]|nr:response regulator [Candidatus Omnitrophota bacterium]
MVRKKILLVDDEKGFTAMLKLNLETAGNYDVRVENEADKAINAAMQFKPNLILMDVIMPKMEGPDVAFEIKSNSMLSSTPIVFLTATVTRDEVEAQGGRIGGHTFIAKPALLPELIQSIENNISLN